MKKTFITKATSILLASQIVLSAAPITVKAEENLTSTKENFEKMSEVEIPTTTSPKFQVPEDDISESNEEASSSDNFEELGITDAQSIQENTIEESVESLDIENQQIKIQAVAIVTNEAGLRAALEDSTITQIQLANDITMTAPTFWLGATKTIDGNNHTLTFRGNDYLEGRAVNQELKIANIRIVSAAQNTIRQTNTSTVSIENVTYVGFDTNESTGRFVLLQGANSVIYINGHNTFDNGSFIQGPSFTMTLNNYATLKVNNNGRNRSIESTSLTSAGRINLNTGSTLDITQNNLFNNVETVVLFATSSEVNVSERATLKITSAPDTTRIREALRLSGTLNVASDGTVDIIGRSRYSALNVGATSIFQEGSNIRVQNNNSDGTAIGSNQGVTRYTIFSSRGLQTWERGTNLSGPPTFNYSGFIQGSFSLNTALPDQVTSNISSNDAQFNATFNSSRVAKIVTGNFNVSAKIAKTTINELNNASTAVTGTGEPNATISILNGNSVIATGQVGIDGLFNLPIARQQLGDTITARIIVNGVIAEASTVIGENSDELIAPELRSIFSDNVFVNGTIDGTARFVAVYINGVFLRTAAVNADRTFSVYTGDRNVMAGQMIEVSGVTRDGDNGPIIDESTRASSQVQDRFLVPAINPMYVGDVFVNGTIGGTARFVAVYVNGVFLRTAAVNADRTFSVYTGDRNVMAGQMIEVSGVTRDGDNGPIIDESTRARSQVQNRFGT